MSARDHSAYRPADATSAPDALAYACLGYDAAAAAFHASGGTRGGAIIAVLCDGTHPHPPATPEHARLLNARRVRVFDHVPAAPEAARALKGFEVLVADGFSVVGGRNATFDAFVAVLNGVAASAKTDVQTAVLHGGQSLRNVIGNLRRYADNPGLAAWGGAAAGRTGVLVSAGPSLGRNIGVLARHRDKVVVVAAQTALKPLLEAGVEPDAVCSLDHSHLGTRFMQGLPPDLRTVLVAHAAANPLVLDVWQRGGQDRRTLLIGHPTADDLLGDASPALHPMPPATTVAHLAFDVIALLGCATCVLVGQDLGFSDGLAYAPGTGYDDAWRPETGRFCTFEMKQWEHIARDRRVLVRTTDWKGNPAYTETRLARYLAKFEEMFAASPMRVIDATEGGVAKQNCETMPLEDALTSLPATPRPDLPSGRAGRGVDVDDVLARRADESDAVADLSKQSAALLERVKQAPGDAAVVDAAIARLDSINARLHGEHSRSVSMCQGLMQDVEAGRLIGNIARARADGDSVTLRRLQATHDAAYARETAAAAETLATVLRAA